MSDSMKTLTFRTTADFATRFQQMDGRIDENAARRDAFVRAGNAEAAGQCAAEHTKLCAEFQGMLLDEVERHWGPHILDNDGTMPEFPDDWRFQFYGRILRISYEERQAFKD
jgi:hypothetical protein